MRDADAQPKDCFSVYGRTQSSEDTLWACCRGVFDDDNRNALGWVWHEDLSLYVDKSKCDKKKLREILIKKLKARDEKQKSNSVQEVKEGTSEQKKNIQRLPKSQLETSLVCGDLGSCRFDRSFRGADLAGAVFDKRVENADFRGANLEGASFENAVLPNANFEGANLKNVNFNYTYLKNATFKNAILTGASLKGAVLKGANFLGVRLTLAQLSVAYWVDAILDTVLEQGLRDLEKESKKVTGQR